MDYITILKKNDYLTRRDFLNSFVTLEGNYESKTGERKQISLHCKYNISEILERFIDEDVEIHLKSDEAPDIVKNFLEKWDFEKEDELPNDLKNILGNYNGAIFYFSSHYV